MSTLKSILHHWNSSSSSYDTLHPETEKSQVTDWDQGIVDTLASTALGSLISTLSSDSLMAKLVKLVLNATGVKYLMGTNGYICFGSLFGGLIIQWVYGATNTKQSLALPIAFTTHGLGVGNDNGSAANRIGVKVDTVSTYMVYARPDNSSELTITSFNGIFIGY